MKEIFPGWYFILSGSVTEPEGRGREMLDRRDKRMDGGKVEWRAGGHWRICSNGCTENAHLEKSKKQINEDMASEM